MARPQERQSSDVELEEIEAKNSPLPERRNRAKTQTSFPRHPLSSDGPSPNSSSNEISAAVTRRMSSKEQRQSNWKKMGQPIEGSYLKAASSSRGKHLRKTTNIDSSDNSDAAPSTQVRPGKNVGKLRSQRKRGSPGKLPDLERDDPDEFENFLGIYRPTDSVVDDKWVKVARERSLEVFGKVWDEISENEITKKIWSFEERCKKCQRNPDDDSDEVKIAKNKIYKDYEKEAPTIIAAIHYKIDDKKYQQNCLAHWYKLTTRLSQE